MLLRNVRPRSFLPGNHLPSFSPVLSRSFQSTPELASRLEHDDHYATLDVRHDASPSDIKRSFYRLSKAHHPDHNPDNPEASRKFMRISEAYNILGNGEKRAAYDRDVLGHRTNAGTDRRHGSYHSTGPAGGRPASGLSRRRGGFQGPPPSFYRSGGWGAHSAKRKSAHDESIGSGSGNGGPRRKAGMGYGQDPYGHRDDVPHFDRAGHQKTGEWVAGVAERRAAASQRRPKFETETETGTIANFFVVSGILILAVATPWVLFSGKEQGRKRVPQGNG
jgi:curved DNA-binding protein CbpA